MDDFTQSADTQPGSGPNENNDPIVETLVSDLPEQGDSGEQEDSAEWLVAKIDGEERRVKKDDLLRDYQKYEAGSKRLEEAAAARREIEAFAAHNQQAQHLLAQQIQALDQQIRIWSSEQQPDWESLLRDNPHEYLIQQERFAKRAQTVQQMQQAQQVLQHQHYAQQQAALTQHLQKETAKITEMIPEWKKKEVREREEVEMISWLKEQGYSDQDLQALNYSRAENIRLARMAWKYSQAARKAAQLKKEQNTEAAVPVPTVGGNARSKQSISNPGLSFKQFAELRRKQIANR